MREIEAQSERAIALPPAGRAAIYQVVAGGGEAWPEHVRRAQELGFDQILLSATDDPAGAAGLARASGLGLLLDLDLAFHPDQAIAALADAGVAGFRCLGLDSAPPAECARLIADARARHPGLLFLAWTPGLSAAAVAALAPSGFDFTFSSSAWWDFRASWLGEDAERLAAVAPAIAMPWKPESTGFADQAESRRALAFAACYGAGWMVPMGTTALDQDIARLNDGPRGGEGAALVSSPGADLLVFRGRDRALLVNASTTAQLSVRGARFLPLLGAGGAERSRHCWRRGRHFSRLRYRRGERHETVS